MNLADNKSFEIVTINHDGSSQTFGRSSNKGCALTEGRRLAAEGCRVKVWDLDLEDPIFANC